MQTIQQLENEIQGMNQKIIQTELEMEIIKLKSDRLTLALFVYGHQDDSYSPEVYDVMKRVKPEIINILYHRG